uniref:Core protein VP7 n=1 Tax=Kemerovo virus TaxID=40064 RepID=A0A5S9ED64_9REOV|nr:intermediate capsid protein VP7 [Kemerovo virus]
MDAYTARALSVLEGLAISGDPRSHRDPTTEATMSIFAMRFNSTTSRPVIGTPTTREARRNNFYAAVDVAFATLNITSTFVMPGYIQNPQTLAILARDEIPYTPSTFRRVQRIRVCSSDYSNVREEFHPYAHHEAITTPGVILPAPAGGGVACYAISTHTLQIHLDPMQAAPLAGIIFPDREDVIMAEFTWQRLANAIDNNAVVDQGTEIELSVEGAVMRAGTPFTATSRNHIMLTSYEPVDTCTAHITCHRYWVTSPPRVVYDSMEADILAVYTYKDDFWDALRGYVLQTLGMPMHHYPLRPVTEFRQNLAIAILSRLFDVYCAMSPEINAPVAAQGPLAGIAHRLQAALRAFRLGR